jgi:EAL domain-containing protein (putative c-di-GMP-specific phosphodiesterase class I)
MAHNFGCRAVAVGISAEADFQTVLSLDCDMGQGFLLGKPMSVKQIDAMIANSGRAVT